MSGDILAAIWKLTNKPKPKQCHIKYETGKVFTERKDILSRWRRYCKDLYASNKRKTQTKQPNEGNSCCQEPDIMASKVKKAIKPENDKYLGYENIPTDVIMKTGVNVIKMLQMICIAFWKSQNWAVEWKKSVFIPLLKKGNVLQCQNSRMLALIPHASKILLYIIIDRIQQYLSREISDTQASFRHGLGKCDHIATVRSMILKINERSQPIVLLFINHLRAFDSVKHELM